MGISSLVESGQESLRSQTSFTLRPISTGRTRYVVRISINCVMSALHRDYVIFITGRTRYVNHVMSALPMADLGGVRECKCTPLWWLVMYFCVHNCTTPSNDYAAVACSNNNQAQLHTRVSVPYWYLDVWLGLELLWDIHVGLPAILNNSLASGSDWKWAWQPKFSLMRFARQWLNPLFEISRSATDYIMIMWLHHDYVNFIALALFFGPHRL